MMQPDRGYSHLNSVLSPIYPQLPASKPWKAEWKENVFALYNGSEDRVQYWQARYTLEDGMVIVAGETRLWVS